MQKFTDFSKKIKQENDNLIIKEASIFNINCENTDELINALDILCENFILSYIDYNINEEFTQSDLDDVIFNMPDNVDSLVGYETKIGNDTLTVDWEDPKNGILSIQLNGEKIDVGDERVYDYEALKQVLLSKLGELVKSDTTDEPKKDISPEAKKKLTVLRTIIRPRLINKFANEPVDQNRIYNAIKDYLESGADEDDIKTELDQKAIIDFCLDMLDVILSNKNLASLISMDTTVASLSESKLLEGKKTKKSKKTPEESVDVKLDMLLKLGLVDAKIYNRAKRALTNKKNAGTVPNLRNLLFDLLDKLISYIKKDPTLYNRIRINVMKEMKGILPTKKEIEEASLAGRKAAEENNSKEVPEQYSKHYFTKEAWLEGYNSFNGRNLDTEPESSEVEEIDEKFIEYPDYDMWGWIRQDGTLVMPTKKDADSEEVVYHDVLAKRSFPNGYAFNAGWIRWFLHLDELHFNTRKVDDTTYSALSKGLNKIITYSSDRKKFGHFVGRKAKRASQDIGGTLHINSYSIFFEQPKKPNADVELYDNDRGRFLNKVKNYIDSKLEETPGKNMKTLKQFKQEKSIYNESISLSEIDAITNVVEQLAAVSESTYPTLEEALSEVSEILAQLGVSFNSADAMDNESGTIELPLEDLEGQAMISVFGGESVEDKVEGDLSIKIVTEKSSDGVIIKPEIMVSFEGDEAMSLSDIEFEVDVDDEEEPEEMEGEEEIEEYCDVCDTEYCTCDEMELTEEYIDGQTFNVILFKPATRRFFSVIISAKNEKEIADIVVSDYPQYTINAIYPVKVS